MKKVEEDRLVHSLLAEFEMVPVNRRFGAVVRWNIEPGASGGQNVQDAVDQPAGITAGSANVRLCWGKVVLNNRPEIIVDFPECHDPQFYPRGLIIIGSLPSYFRSCAFGKLPIRSSNVAIPREVFFDVGMFPVGEWWGEDTDMWGRVALRYPIGFSSGYYAIYNVGATNRTCNMLKSAEIHPFVRTACQAIEGGGVSGSILPDLEQYITKEILQTAQINLKAGRPDLARDNLSQCHQKFFGLKQISLRIWTYLPTSLFYFYQWILGRGLDGILIVKMKLHPKIKQFIK